MDSHFTRRSIFWVLSFAFVIIHGSSQDDDSTTLVPAIITFGDSTVDVGNNDYIHTVFKANKPPYGRDFINNRPTGRFCNGKLSTDLTSETLGFTTYVPPYLSPNASENYLIGANFASAGSGYDDKTAETNHAIPMSKQLEYYKQYQRRLREQAGSNRSATIIKEALYISSAGSGDFVQNYYVNPQLKKTYTPDQYSSMLVRIITNFIQDLYDLGARKIGVTSLPPLGCLPAVITLFGHHSKECVTRINNDAQGFNRKLNASAANLREQLPDIKLVVFNIYSPLYDLIQNPSDSGFVETSRACCGTGTIETTTLLCNEEAPGTCSNATEYIFWDSISPSEAANTYLADAFISQGLTII